MAVEETTPHGLKRYTAGTDAFPGRTGHNDMVDKLNMIPGLTVGPLSSRPPASSGLRFYLDEATKRLYVNTGTEWAGIAEVGALAPSNVVVGGVSSEGASARAARVDHSHALPLATSSTHGGMSSTDKALLDGATSTASPNRLLKANSNGDIAVNAPTSGAHPAHKTYVDTGLSGKSDTGHKHSGSDITTGTINPARIANATPDLDGLLPRGWMKALMDATGANVASAFVRRYSNGSFSTSQISLTTAPTESSHAARKDYVDNGLGTKANSSHDHDASDTKSGVFNPARLPLASSSSNGAMSASDKSTLDDASASLVPNSLVKRNASNQFNAGTPTSSYHAANKMYVDALIARQVPLGFDLGSTNLNTVLHDVDAYVAGGANATVANGYPFNGCVGPVKVRRFNGSGTWVVQWATHWLTMTTYVRSTNDGGTTFTDWSRQMDEKTLLPLLAAKSDTVHKHSGSDITTGTIDPARIQKATAAADGLMRAADKAKLDTATTSLVGGAIVQRFSDGQIYAAEPKTTISATPKSYVDALVATIAPGGWYTLNLRTGWVAMTGFGVPQARLVGDKVELRGVVDRTTGTPGDIIFSLLTEMRPSAHRLLTVSVMPGSVVSATVTADSGTFYVPVGSTVQRVTLDGLFFHI